jgi:hypothetical protein
MKAERGVRSERPELVVLALFALACQFLVVLGHIHRDRLGDNPQIWAIAIASGKATATGTLKAASTDLPTSPQRNPGGLGDDFCAICTNVSPLGALIVPAAPAVLSRILVSEEPSWSFAAAEASVIDQFPFSARGPPRA